MASNYTPSGGTSGRYSAVYYTSIGAPTSGGPSQFAQPYTYAVSANPAPNYYTAPPLAPHPEPLLTRKKEILFSMLFGPDWQMIVETIEALEKL